jgi:hypothetical protein
MKPQADLNVLADNDRTNHGIGLDQPLSPARFGDRP